MIAETEKLDILFRDDYLIAVHKPSGLLVHRSEIDRHETRFALQIVRNQIAQYVYPVHRLDKPTSGVLVLALSADVARDLTQAFTSRAVHKSYRALVRGFLAAQGSIDHPLGRVDDDYDEQCAVEKQPAITHFQCVQQYEISQCIERYPVSRFSLVDAFPETGRQHQIRRHFKHLSHPLIGDVRYGRGAYNRFFRAQFNCQRLLLACYQIRFTHPRSQQELMIDCPLAVDFDRTLASLRPYIKGEKHSS
jgi:tRNA pseudouridine65 synthase